MKIEYLPVNSLIPYERNAKKHPKEQIERIAASLKEFGFRQNLVVDKNNVVVVGHGRLEAAKLLGLDKVPCERVDDLTEDQIKAYRLVDNRVAESEIDVELEFNELQDIDMDLSDFGVESFSVDDLNSFDGYNAKTDTRESFEKVFTFPVAMKHKITCYLKKHYDDVRNRIMKEAEEYGD